MRYQVVYGDAVGAPKRYALWDAKDQAPICSSDSKSKIIQQSQILNNLTPVDGDEGTYGRQLAEKGER